MCLNKTTPKLLRSMLRVALEEIGFDKDYLHILMTIPPKCSVASVMGKLKDRRLHT